MKIGILQCGHAPEYIQEKYGNYTNMFQALLHAHDFDYATWNVVDMEFPGDLAEADGWLITGSRHGAYEDLPFIAPLSQLIRDIQHRGQPLVGVCFGHQIIAHALGGTVVKFDGGWCIGRQTYQLDGLGEVALNAWHQDQVISLPEGARRVGGNAFCQNAAIAYGDTIYTIQPHPEIHNEMVQAYINGKRLEGVPPAPLLDRAEALVNDPTGDFVMADHFAKVFKLQAHDAHD